MILTTSWTRVTRNSLQKEEEKTEKERLLQVQYSLNRIRSDAEIPLGMGMRSSFNTICYHISFNSR
jgi:hypothetical protein